MAEFSHRQQPGLLVALNVTQQNPSHHASHSPPTLPLSSPSTQDARDDLAGTEVLVAQLQAQVDALMAAGEMAADAAAQLDEAGSALAVGGEGGGGDDACSSTAAGGMG